MGGEVAKPGERLANAPRELPVVAEVLAQAGLQREAAVLAEASADVRVIDADVDARGPQHGGGPDPGELQQLGGLDAAEGQDHLAPGVVVDHSAALAHPTPTARSPSNSNLVANARTSTVRFGRSRAGWRKAWAELTRSPDADVRHREADAGAVRLVEVVDGLEPDSVAGGDEGIADRVRVRDLRDGQRAAGAARRGGAEPVVLDLPVARQDGVPTPALVPEALELVPIGLLAAVVDKAVDGAGATQHLAADPAFHGAAPSEGRVGKSQACLGSPRSLPNPLGMRISGLLSSPPASTSSTRVRASSDSRLASTHPADPAPTTM